MLSFIPQEIERYVASHSAPETDLYRALARETYDNMDNPQMQVGPVEGVFLRLLARAIGARRVLEIGTFTGYSTLMLAEGVVEGGEVITCDVDRSATAIAERYWRKSPHGHKINLRLGRATETVAEVDGPLDMVFIDADKKNYIRYWDACVPKARPGGLLVADNVLWSGRVLDPQEADDHAIAAFNRHVRGDDRVEAVMLTVRDGVTVACKR